MRCERAGLAGFFLALTLVIIQPGSAAAKTTVIDDAGSQALQPVVDLLWKTATPVRGPDNSLMTGTLTLRVHLNVLPWLHRNGRIYLNLPAQPPGPLHATWTTQGRLGAGDLQSGNRVMIFSGVINSPSIEDLLTITFSVDGRVVTRPFPVGFHFEMDED